MSKVQAADEKVSAENVSAVISLPDGMLPDFITGNPVKETPKELVRQELARALLFEYRISPQDMQPDFPVKVGSKRKRTFLAV